MFSLSCLFVNSWIDKLFYLHIADKCKCNQGYIGDDCAQRNDTPPVVIRPANAVCDVRVLPCITVTVIGEGFVDSPSLVCYVKEVLI